MDFELLTVPPGCICEYSDGTKVRMGPQKGWVAVGLACGGTCLVATALIA